MFSFTKYTHEIWDISKEKSVPVDIAYDMFRADIACGEPYNTGGVLPDFDFTVAFAQWDKLTQDEKENAYEEWHTMLRCAYDDLVIAYREGKPMTPIARKAVE